MFYNLKEGILDFGEGKCRYISFGRGVVPLIMLQGLNTRGIKGAGASLALMYGCFAKKFRVYLFDRSEELADDVTIECISNDVAAAMDTLNIKNAFVLGVSMGGMVAQQLALSRPDLVKSMVLAVTASQTNPTIEKVIFRWIDLTREDKFKELVIDMAEKMYSDKYLKKYKPFLPILTILQKPKDKERFIKLAKACLTASTYENLEKVHCPTLVIGGEDDKIVTADASREIAEKLKCELHIYTQLGHAAYEEARDFNSRVYRFFEINF